MNLGWATDMIFLYPLLNEAKIGDHQIKDFVFIDRRVKLSVIATETRTF